LGRGLAREAVARLPPPPVEPRTQFSRTRLTHALDRLRSTGAHQARLVLGAAPIPLMEVSPNVSRDRLLAAPTCFLSTHCDR